MQKKTLNTMQLELYLAEKKTSSFCFMLINVSPHHEKFSGVFLNIYMIHIYIVAESLFFIVLQLFTYEKVKFERKQKEQPFANNLQTGVL